MNSASRWSAFVSTSTMQVHGVTKCQVSSTLVAYLEAMTSSTSISLPCKRASSCYKASMGLTDHHVFCEPFPSPVALPPRGGIALPIFTDISPAVPDGVLTSWSTSPSSVDTSPIALGNAPYLQGNPTIIASSMMQTTGHAHEACLQSMD